MKKYIIHIPLVFLLMLTGNNCGGSGSPCKKACEYSQKCEEKQCPTCVYSKDSIEECLYFCDGLIVIPCTEKLDAYIQDCVDSNWCEDKNNCENYIKELCNMEMGILDCVFDSWGSCGKINNCSSASNSDRDALDNEYKCQECLLCNLD